MDLFSVGADGLLGGRFEGFFLVIANLFVELDLLRLILLDFNPELTDLSDIFVTVGLHLGEWLRRNNYWLRFRLRRSHYWLRLGLRGKDYWLRGNNYWLWLGLRRNDDWLWLGLWDWLRIDNGSGLWLWLGDDDGEGGYRDGSDDGFDFFKIG